MMLDFHAPATHRFANAVLLGLVLLLLCEVVLELREQSGRLASLEGYAAQSRTDAMVDLEQKVGDE